MKNSFHYIIFGILLLVFVPPAGFSLEKAEPEKIPVEVTASVDKQKITIGDKIKYILEARADKDIEIRLPEFSKDLGGLSIKDSGSSEKGWFGTRTFRHWYVLDTYVSGRYTIPEAVIKYRQKGQKEWQKVTVPAVSVRVESVLESAEDSSDIRGIAGPVRFPVKIHWYTWGIFALIIIIIVVTAFLLKKRRPKEVISPFRPAHEIAYEALEMLKSKGYIKQGKFMSYYVELSNIVRQYLERRFHLRAPEMTTEEFLMAVKANRLLSHELRDLLRVFLSHCDMVKFAKYSPPEKESDLSFESAKRLVDQTKEEKQKTDIRPQTTDLKEC
ncbi:MAG: hypothetical protein JW928_09325 [Candidatus Aureabacteria bacterium]|nr:hypothetical protein [Candidatus Auribacterota bacterium]